MLIVLAIFTHDECAAMKRKVSAFDVGRIKGFTGKTFAEGVGGKVYVVSEGILVVKDFFFDDAQAI